MKFADDVSIGREANDLSLGLMSFSIDYSDKLTPEESETLGKTQEIFRRFIERGHEVEEHRVREFMCANGLKELV